MSLQDMVLALAVILFFMVDGFLIIFNINSISVTKDIQFYGLLKTIGISPQAVKAGNLLPDGSDIADGSSRWVAPRLYYNAMDRAPAVGKFAGRFHSGKPPLGSTCCISPFFPAR